MYSMCQCLIQICFRSRSSQKVEGNYNTCEDINDAGAWLLRNTTDVSTEVLGLLK